jgi:hypothetical protein
MAGPDGSGTDPGGTGGGRSLNSCAAAGFAIAIIRPPANASAAKRHPLRPDRQIPWPPEVMNMLFTENAANSSLQHRKALPLGIEPDASDRIRARVSTHLFWRVLITRTVVHLAQKR